MKRFQVTVNGNTYEVEVEELQGGQSVSVPVAQVVTPVQTVVQTPVAAPVAAPAAPVQQAVAPAGSNVIEAPMQGKIVGVKVSVGTAIKAGDVVAILEAMKMENEIVSPFSGTVASVNVTDGQSVEAGDLLVSLN